MASYDLSWDEAIDLPDIISDRLLLLAAERNNKDREDLARKIANNVGTMFFGDKMKTGSENSSSPANNGKRTAYWSGGKTTRPTDLRPNPHRPRLKELQNMAPQPIDPFALGKILNVDQSITGKKTVTRSGGQ